MENKLIPLGTEKGVPYGYAEYSPPGATKLLVSMHGHGARGNGKSELYKVLKEGAAKRIAAGTFNRTEFVVVSPQYASTSGYPYPGTLNNFINLMMDKYPVDEIHLIGLSGGGIGVLNYIASYPVTSAVAIAASGPSKIGIATKTPIWLFHGDSDTKVKTSESIEFANAYNVASPLVRAKLTLFPFEGHSAYVWDTVYKQDKVYDWMIKQGDTL